MKYIDAAVTCNRISSEMEAVLQSVIGVEHPSRTNDVILFDVLADYYKSLIHALNRTHLYSPALEYSRMGAAPLQWKWNLFPKDIESDNQNANQAMESPSLTERDQLYLGRGYEHHLKTKLIENWSRWIVEDMNHIDSDARKDCHHALADAASDEGKWELTELDTRLAWEWTRCELSLVVASNKLEDILRQ